MPLSPIQIQQLHRDRPGLEPGPDLVVNEPFVNGSEPALPQEIRIREPASGHLELGEREGYEDAAH